MAIINIPTQGVASLALGYVVLGFGFPFGRRFTIQPVVVPFRHFSNINA